MSLNRISITGALAAAALTALAVWSVLATGSSSVCLPRVTSTATATCKHAEPGPLNVDVRVDQTMFNGDPTLAAATAARIESIVETPVMYGGTIVISQFGRSAARSAVIFHQDVPSLDELRLSQRAGMQDQVRAAVKRALAGLAGRQASAARGTGSDILGAYALPAPVQLKSGLRALRVVFTDGKVDEPGFRLVAVLKQQGARTALAGLRKLLPTVNRPDALLILGVGGTGGRIVDEDPLLTESLTAVQRQLCPQITKSCDATSTL